MKQYSKNTLCNLCLVNALPFKAKRLHWGRGSYVTVTSYDFDSSKSQKYFNVYGYVSESRIKVLKRYVKQDLTKEILIPGSNIFAWKLV